MTITETIYNTSNSYMGMAKIFVGAKLGNPDMVANGTAQKAQAETAQQIANAKAHSQGIGREIEGQAEAKIGALTGDKTLNAKGQIHQAVGSFQQHQNEPADNVQQQQRVI